MTSFQAPIGPLLLLPVIIIHTMQKEGLSDVLGIPKLQRAEGVDST